jgi:ferrochelatase
MEIQSAPSQIPPPSNGSSQVPRIGVVLVNQGTPDSYQVRDVRKYLREFLMDSRVIDIPYPLRFLLVQGIIAPFRAPKSAKIYKELWTENGSPLKFYGMETARLLQEKLGPDYAVRLAMRYQQPSLEKVLQQLYQMDLELLIVIPLFPQYASATTGSVYEKTMNVASKWPTPPPLVLTSSFFDHPQFIAAFKSIGEQYLGHHAYDKILFTYHGLPERQIRKGDPYKTCLTHAHCCNTLTHKNKRCYRAQCFATSRLLAQALGLKEDDYVTAFQSRLGNDPWIKPYTDATIEALVADGKKNILAFTPSFVADCLETTIEVGEEYKELFEEKGGEHWTMAESLNTHPLWIELLASLVHTQTPQANPYQAQTNSQESMANDKNL